MYWRVGKAGWEEVDGRAWIECLGGGCPGKAGCEEVLASARGGGCPGKAGWLTFVSARSRMLRFANAWSVEISTFTKRPPMDTNSLLGGSRASADI